MWTTSETRLTVLVIATGKSKERAHTHSDLETLSWKCGFHSLSLAEASHMVQSPVLGADWAEDGAQERCIKRSSWDSTPDLDLLMEMSKHFFFFCLIYFSQTSFI